MLVSSVRYGRIGALGDKPYQVETIAMHFPKAYRSKPAVHIGRCRGIKARPMQDRGGF